MPALTRYITLLNGDILERSDIHTRLGRSLGSLEIMKRASPEVWRMCRHVIVYVYNITVCAMIIV